MSTRNGFLAPGIALASLALVVMPAAVFAQGMEEGEEMAHEQRHAEMSAEAREAIEARAAEFAEAFNSGDVEATAAFYTDDAVVMPPGEEPIEGVEAIREGLTEELAAMEGMRMTFRTDEVFAVHEGALEVGGYTIEGDDGSHVDHGKYMVAWKNTDDGWKISRDIWNSSMGGE